MDADRFDALSRSLSTTPSRRGALRLLVGSIFGSLITLGATDAAAHNALTACKKKSGTAKKKCLKKAKKHAAAHASEPPPTCTDGIRNGSETGVDCGGPTCPPCGATQGCSGPQDCASGFCATATRTCQTCSPPDAGCGTDAFGHTCTCVAQPNGNLCGWEFQTLDGTAFGCNQCPPETDACVFGRIVRCYKRCGTA